MVEGKRLGRLGAAHQRPPRSSQEAPKSPEEKAEEPGELRQKPAEISIGNLFMSDRKDRKYIETHLSIELSFSQQQSKSYKYNKCVSKPDRSKRWKS